MGLFSSKKKYYVNSTTCNLWGSDDQMKYIPSTILSGVIKGEKDLGKFLMNQVQRGPGVDLRKYYNWSRRSGYSAWIGDASSAMWTDVKVSRTELAETLTTYELKLDSNQEVEVNYSEISWFDPDYVAKTWCSVYKPTLTDKDYTATTTPTKIGERQEQQTFYDTDEEGNKYSYKQWVTVPIYRTDVLITFTNGSTQLIEMTGVDLAAKFLYYSYTIYTLGSNGQVMSETKHTGYYQYNSGKWYFDAYFGESKANYNTYFSIIPFRDDKSWISKSSNNTWYTWASKAYKRATGGKNLAGYNNLMDQLKKSDGVDSTAFIYEVFGVPINTAWQPGLKFLYNYFYNLYLNEKISTSQASAVADITNVVAQTVVKKYTSSVARTIYIKSTTGVCNYDTRISWGGMTYYLKSGTHYENAKVGTYYSRRTTTTESYQVGNYDPETGETTYTTKYTTYYWSIWSHQKSENRYEEIWVRDLAFSSTIYHGKSVSYKAYDELANKGDVVTGTTVSADALGESGFVVPIEWQTFKELSVFDRHNLGMCCQMLVLNSWKKVKIRWYQRGIFKWVGFIIAAILAIFTGGATLTAYLIAYANMAVLTAQIVAAAICAALSVVASALIMPLIMKAVSAILPKAIAQVVTAVIVIVAVAYGQAALAGQVFTYGSICTVQTAFVLMNSVGNAYATLRQEATNNMLGQMTDMMKTFEEKMEEISSYSEKLFGTSGFWNRLTNDVCVETPDQYLTRTLMTGSDIAQTTMDLVYDFADNTLSLDLQGTS